MNSKTHATLTPSVLLWGGKHKAKLIEEMLKESNLGVCKIIFDDTLESPSFETSALFINTVDMLIKNLHTVTHFVACIGAEHGYARVKTAEYLIKIGLKPITLIHHKSFVEPTAHIGEGCQIMPCAVVHKFSTIGSHSLINTNATIDHDCTVGRGVHIMGSASIAGKVDIGDYATIGTNATILPYLKIGEGAFVGAGAVVTKDVEPYSVVSGVPAKKMRSIEPKFFESSLQQLLEKSNRF